MNWIRIAVGIMRDPTVVALSEAVGVSVPATTGHLMGVLTSMAEGAKTGDLSSVSDRTIEQWAMWAGKRGRFAAAFRAHLCDAQGVVRAWNKYNGAAIRRADDSAERAKAWREQRKANAQRTRSDRVANAERAALRDETRRDETNTTTSSAAAAAVVVPPAAAAAATTPGEDVLAVARQRFSDPAHQQAAVGYLRAAPYPVAVVASLDALASGLNGPNGAPVAWADIGRALLEMQAAGVRFSPKAVRAFAGKLADTPAGEAVTWDDVVRRFAAEDAKAEQAKAEIAAGVARVA